MQATVQYMF